MSCPRAAAITLLVALAASAAWAQDAIIIYAFDQGLDATIEYFRQTVLADA